MSKIFKIWLWFALILSIATTTMNAVYGRWLSVAIAIAALTGLCALLFARKKWGFPLMCICYILAFAVGVFQGISGETNIISAIIMSFIGSALIPGVTYLFLRREKK